MPHMGSLSVSSTLYITYPIWIEKKGSIFSSFWENYLFFEKLLLLGLLLSHVLFFEWSGITLGISVALCTVLLYNMQSSAFGSTWYAWKLLSPFRQTQEGNTRGPNQKPSSFHIPLSHLERCDEMVMHSPLTGTWLRTLSLLIDMPCQYGSIIYYSPSPPAEFLPDVSL